MTDFITTTDFGFLREKAGLSIPEVAQLIGKSDRPVRRYESRNGNGSPAPRLLRHLCFVGLWFVGAVVHARRGESPRRRSVVFTY